MNQDISNKALIESALEVVNPKEVRGLKIGQVGAALVTDKGTVYQGVCLDTSSGLGFCAERTAIAQMITHKEYKIAKIVAVWNDNPSKDLYILPPCGACREYMKNVTEDGLDIDVILGKDKTIKLKDLLPYDWWPDKELVI